MTPGALQAAERVAPAKKSEGGATTQYLDHVLTSLGGQFKLSESELGELASLNKKHANWKGRGFPEDGTYTTIDNKKAMDLHDRLLNYSKTLKALAEQYPKATDYKGKNIAQEQLDALKSKLKTLGYEL